MSGKRKMSAHNNNNDNNKYYQNNKARRRVELIGFPHVLVGRRDRDTYALHVGKVHEWMKQLETATTPTSPRTE